MRILGYMLLLSVMMSGCANKVLKDYEGVMPKLSVKAFFNGKLKAFGVVKNRQGSVIRHFTADIDATWHGHIGQLHETFIFDDGEQQIRTWRLEQLPDGKFRAEANDVVGKHIMATAGNALFMQYVLNIPYKGKTLAVDVDDKMFLVGQGRIINESIMRKWGFRVGSVQLVIEKQ